MPAPLCSQWHGRKDSNLHPTVLETVALPIKLHPLVFDNTCIFWYSGYRWSWGVYVTNQTETSHDTKVSWLVFFMRFQVVSGLFHRRSYHRRYRYNLPRTFFPFKARPLFEFVFFPLD